MIPLTHIYTGWGINHRHLSIYEVFQMFSVLGFCSISCSPIFNAIYFLVCFHSDIMSEYFCTVQCNWHLSFHFSLNCIDLIVPHQWRGHHVRDCMIVGFTTTCAYHLWNCEFEPRSWWGVLDTTLCDKVCQWLATGRWFSPGTPSFLHQ